MILNFQRLSNNIQAHTVSDDYGVGITYDGKLGRLWPGPRLLEAEWQGLARHDSVSQAISSFFSLLLFSLLC